MSIVDNFKSLASLAMKVRDAGIQAEMQDVAARRDPVEVAVCAVLRHNQWLIARPAGRGLGHERRHSTAKPVA